MKQRHIVHVQCQKSLKRNKFFGGCPLLEPGVSDLQGDVLPIVQDLAVQEDVPLPQPLGSRTVVSDKL
jgi:hypothetical protein